jgi:hypothetical protein
VAMLVGGGFYGYVIGIMATLVATSDANSRAISEKMDIVNAWLSFNDLPPNLKRKVRIYFKSFLHERSALDEQAILNDLDPGLRAELDHYLTPQVVRDSLLFGDLEPEFLSKLTSMLRPVPAAPGDTLQARQHAAHARRSRGRRSRGRGPTLPAASGQRPAASGQRPAPRPTLAAPRPSASASASASPARHAHTHTLKYLEKHRRSIMLPDSRAH